MRKGWQEKALELSGEGLKEICAPGNGVVGVKFNVGLRTGVKLKPGKKLVVVESDNEEGSRWIESFSGTLGTRTNISKRGPQYLFSVPEDVEIKNSTDIVPGTEKVDVRGAGGFIVTPGSVHVSGHVYHWGGGDVILPMPEELLQYIVGRQEAVDKMVSSITGKYLRGYSSFSTIKIGTRHDTLLRVGGSLRSRGHDEKYISLALQTINDTACEEPLSLKEIEDIIEYAIRIEPKRSPVPEEVRELLGALRRGYGHLLFKRPLTISDKALLIALVEQGLILGEEVEGDVKIPISRRVLAEKAGLDVKTVNRRLNRLKEQGFISIGKDSNNPKESGYIVLKTLVGELSTGEVLLDVRELLTLCPQDKSKDIRDLNLTYSCSGGRMLTTSTDLVVNLKNGPGRLGKGSGDVLDAIEEILSLSNRPLRPKEIALKLNLDPRNRSHMSSISRYLRKLRDRGLIVKDKETGMYYRPESVQNLLEEDLREAGEARDRQAQKHHKERIINAYRLALKKAAKEGRNFDEVPVPEGVKKSKGVSVLEREKEKLERGEHHGSSQDVSEERIEAHLKGQLSYDDLNDREKSEAAFRQLCVLSAASRAPDYRGKE